MHIHAHKPPVSWCAPGLWKGRQVDPDGLLRGKKILAESGSFGFNVSPVLKTRHEDQRVSSAIKGACHQAWQPEFSPWDSHSRRREPTHVSSPLPLSAHRPCVKFCGFSFNRIGFFLQLFFFSNVFLVFNSNP